MKIALKFVRIVIIVKITVIVLGLNIALIVIDVLFATVG